tara:strand:- start:1013 stop:1576 length:564 start_codon:yes stop_codon:yes gene_type:complete
VEREGCYTLSFFIKNYDMGKLQDNIKDYQLKALSEVSVQKKSYTVYEIDKYSEYQNYLYNRKLKGLKSLTRQELDNMCEKKKQRISRVHRKAQKAINRYKQQLTIKWSNLIFKTLFPESPFTQFLIGSTETDDKHINTLNFKDLKIDKDQIIRIFIEEGILDSNFYSLKENPYKLPKLKNANKTKRM